MRFQANSDYNQKILSPAADTDKTIKLLKSHNQPVIRKRQVMRTAFGDYRSKMQDEEKKLRLGEHIRSAISI